MTVRPGSIPRRALALPAIRWARRRAAAVPAIETGQPPSGQPGPAPVDGVARHQEPIAPARATRTAIAPAPLLDGAVAGSVQPDEAGDHPEVVRERVRKRRLFRKTVSRAWNDRVLGLSAEAAFWSLLSLPPLFLGLLGSLGFFSGTLGPDTVNDIEQHLLAAFSRAFSPSVVEQVIQPMVSDLLRRGRADVVSIGFLLSLWAGSSATATFVNTVTIAYGMRDLRGAVRSRLLALGLFVLIMIIGVVLLPLLVLGPSVLIELVPAGARGDATRVLNAVYWPSVALILLAGLITFYHLAVPERLPWRRGVPGALLAAAVFLLGGTALRTYISFVVGQGLTYGTLAAPIAALLFFFVLALAVLLGAELNATIEQMWPARPTRRRARRTRRALAANHAAKPVDVPPGAS